MHYVYLLKLKNEEYYTGQTSDLRERLEKHREGGVPATRNLRPLELIYYCAFSSQKTAIVFEKYLKTGSGQAFRNKHLIGPVA